MDMRLPNTFSKFPVSGKKPLVSWGEYSKRLPTTEELEKWSGNKEWGIATGPVSKILVLDDDGGLAGSHHFIPNTLSQATPRGGKHYFFRWTPELENKVTTKVGVLDKVDVRGDGGFVCFYGFDKPHFMTPIALPPKWLIDLLPNRTDTNNVVLSENESALHKSKLQEMLDAIQPGNRNDSFTRIAGSLRGRGYSSSDIFGILSPKAREVEFELNELRIICESVGRYAPNERIDETQASSIEDFLKDQETVEWLVPGMIAKRSIGFVVGLPETGKTWMLIDLAVECAKGGMWLNRFPVEKAKVLFVDQERFKGETQRRFRAILSASEAPNLSLKTSLFVRCGTTTRINLQSSFEAFRKELSELKPDLVIVDSFVTFHTCEENNRKDIQSVLERVKELRNEFGCTFLFIHHENKMAFDKEAGEPSISQMAGSIAIPAVAETVFTVRRTDVESSMVFHTKSTLSQTSSPFLIKVSDIDDAKTMIKVEAY